MRLAINLTRDPVAGITSTNINLLNHLLRNDHDFVGIELNGNIYMKGPVLFRSFAPETFDHHILNIHHLPINKVVKKSKNLKEVERHYKEIIDYIRKILRESKPDCILLNGTFFIPWLISIAAKHENLPIVLWYAGVLTREVENYPPKIRTIFRSMERSIINRADNIIFPSELSKTTVEKEVINKRLNKSYVIPNPIAPIFTEPSPTEQSLERRIAAVGRYTPIKNFDIFFDIHRRLKSEHWNHTASFVTNITNFSQKIETLPRDIKLVPPMPPEGLKRFYLTQGLIVCPSNFETFGNAPIEAACLGIPVLVNENMGCADILRQARLENMIVNFKDQDLVIKKVKELCGQNILPKQLNALRKIVDYHLVGDEIEAVIMSTINHKSKSHLRKTK